MTHASLLLSDHVLCFKMYLQSWVFSSLVFSIHHLLKIVSMHKLSSMELLPIQCFYVSLPFSFFVTFLFY